MTTPTALRKPRTGRSSSEISITLRRMLLESLEKLGGVDYLMKIGVEEPTAYLQTVAKAIKADDGVEALGLTIVVQAAPAANGPIPGVLNSPVVEHIGPPRLVANHGEVVDMEPTK